MRLGALEAGGTKMVCAVGDENGSIAERKVFPTGRPQETIPELIAYFRAQRVSALGIGCFGPVDLHRGSKTYGSIMATPKTDWINCDIVGAFSRALSIPIGFDTDVNAACMGEAEWGSAKDVSSCIYITIGTGIGVGVMVDRRLLHGMLHPEGGHILLAKHPEDSYPGKCPYHANCFEGLASGPAIAARWHRPAAELSQQEEVWRLEAYYIGQALCSYIMTLSPERIILGGGVMHQTQLLPLVRAQVEAALGGYLQTPQLQDLEHYIVLPALNDDQGVMGCLKLAAEALRDSLE